MTYSRYTGVKKTVNLIDPLFDCAIDKQLESVLEWARSCTARYLPRRGGEKSRTRVRVVAEREIQYYAFATGNTSTKG